MDTVFQIGLINALSACALALIAALAGWLFRRPALTHALWLLVLAKLITPPFITLHIPWHNALPFEEPSTQKVEEPGEPLTAKNDDPLKSYAQNSDCPYLAASPLNDSRLPDSEVNSGLNPNLPIFEERSIEQVDKEVVQSTPTATVPDQSGESIPWHTIVPAIWLTGAGLWFGLAAYRLIRFHYTLRRAVHADATLQAETDLLARQLGLTYGPQVRIIAGPLSPLLWAFGGRACLVLPKALLGRLSQEQRATLLLHELAHLYRQDHWVRLFEVIVTGLFWWHPVVWWARREIREAEEQCCDAWVLWAMPGRARGYALTLMETVDFLSEARPLLPPVASGIGYVHDLQRRLTMIMKGTTPRGLSWWGGLAVLGLAGLLLPALPKLDAQSDPREKDGEAELREEAAKARADVEAARADLQRAQAILRQTQATAEQAKNRSQRSERAGDALAGQGQERGREGARFGGPAAEQACGACHQMGVPKENPLGPDFMKAHDSVVKLSDKINSQRENIRAMETQLKRATEDLSNESWRHKEGGKTKPEKPSGKGPRMGATGGGFGGGEGSAGPGGFGGGRGSGTGPASGPPGGMSMPGFGGFGPPGMSGPGGFGSGGGFVRGGPPGDQERRIDELNKKMEQIMEELQALRQEMRNPRRTDREQPGGGGREGGIRREGRPAKPGQPGAPGQGPAGPFPPTPTPGSPPGGLSPGAGIFPATPDVLPGRGIAPLSPTPGLPPGPGLAPSLPSVTPPVPPASTGAPPAVGPAPPGIPGSPLPTGGTGAPTPPPAPASSGPDKP